MYATCASAASAWGSQKVMSIAQYSIQAAAVSWQRQLRYDFLEYLV